MRIALVSDTYPPLRTSGAVQLRDISREFVKQGHELTVMLPSPELNKPWSIEDLEGVRVLRLKSWKTKDVNYIRRTIGEFLMPFFMLRNLRKTPLRNQIWDGVVWYSPSIFHGPIVNRLKTSSGCKGYLILRDIFPQWAVDMGIMGKGLPYLFFRVIADYQYSVADFIGVQSPGNTRFFNAWEKKKGKNLEVLQNWLGEPADVPCSINIDSGPLSGRLVFVYAGNMGVAQGMDVLITLAEQMKDRKDVGFLFVGRGSDAPRLKKMANDRNLDNVVFYDEIDPDEIPGLYEQCHAGMIALDARHKTHNIPGKFLTYMQAGIPVLASVNPGNDLEQIIADNKVGFVCSDGNGKSLASMAVALVESIKVDQDMPNRCKKLASDTFSASVAVKQITAALMR